jgi:hypothetical protein
MLGQIRGDEESTKNCHESVEVAWADEICSTFQVCDRMLPIATNGSSEKVEMTR